MKAKTEKRKTTDAIEIVDRMAGDSPELANSTNGHREENEIRDCWNMDWVKFLLVRFCSKERARLALLGIDFLRSGISPG